MVSAALIIILRIYCYFADVSLQALAGVRAQSRVCSLKRTVLLHFIVGAGRTPWTVRDHTLIPTRRHPGAEVWCSDCSPGIAGLGCSFLSPTESWEVVEARRWRHMSEMLTWHADGPGSRAAHLAPIYLPGKENKTHYLWILQDFNNSQYMRRNFNVTLTICSVKFIQQQIISCMLSLFILRDWLSEWGRGLCRHAPVRKRFTSSYSIVSWDSKYSINKPSTEIGKMINIQTRSESFPPHRDAVLQ